MCDFRKAKGSKNTVFLGGNAVETNESYTYLKTLATKTMFGLISKLINIKGVKFKTSCYLFDRLIKPILCNNPEPEVCVCVYVVQVSLHAR